MAAFVPCPNVAEVAMIYECFGQNVENVYHFQMPAAITHDTMVALLDDMNGWEIDHMPGVRHNSTQFVRLIGTDLTTQSGILVQLDANPITDGTDVHPSPNNVTIAVKHNTGLRGRSFRGRTFHVGLPADFIIGNEVTAAGRTTLTDRYSLLIDTSVITGGAELCVLSRRHNNAPRAAGVATPVTLITINPTLDSQRRRLPEHNRHR